MADAAGQAGHPSPVFPAPTAGPQGPLQGTLHLPPQALLVAPSRRLAKEPPQAHQETSPTPGQPSQGAFPHCKAHSPRAAPPARGALAAQQPRRGPWHTRHPRGNSLQPGSEAASLGQLLPLLRGNRERAHVRGCMGLRAGPLPSEVPPAGRPGQPLALPLPLTSWASSSSGSTDPSAGGSCSICCLLQATGLAWTSTRLHGHRRSRRNIPPPPGREGALPSHHMLLRAPMPSPAPALAPAGTPAAAQSPWRPLWAERSPGPTH